MPRTATSAEVPDWMRQTVALFGSHTTLLVLAALVERSPMAQQELLTVTGLTRSRLSDVLHRLEGAGAIIASHPIDQRRGMAITWSLNSPVIGQALDDLAEHVGRHNP